MSPKASLALFAGLALILANSWRNISKGSTLSAEMGKWKTYGLEALAIVIAAYVANVADDVANVVLFAIGALWLLFVMYTWGGLTSSAPASSTTSGSATAKKKTTAGTLV